MSLLNLDVILNNILTEGKRDEALAVYLPLFQKRGIEMSLSQLKQALLAKFVNEGAINSLSLESNYYLSGIARYYFNGDLTTNKRLGLLYGTRDVFNTEVCTRLNALIEILRNGYIDSVGTVFVEPEDFGTLPLAKLLRKYNKKINKALGIEDKKKEEAPQEKTEYSHQVGKNYTYEIMYSYEDCKQFKDATYPGSWCITYGQTHYNSYVRRYNIHYVVFKRNGYKSVPREIGNGFTKKKPQDEYGNSLICLLQSNKSAEPVLITSRWNHGSAVDNTQGIEADYAYTKDEFLKVIGCDESILQQCYNEWQENREKRKNKSNVDKSALYQERMDALRKFKYAQILMNGGANPKDLFEYICFVGEHTNDPKYKGMYVVGFTNDNGKNSYCFMDRKTLHFETFKFDTYVRSSQFTQIETQYNVLILSYSYGDPFYIFDLRRHKFIGVDGCYAFKEANEDYFNKKDKIEYLIVAKSQKEQAMIDCKSAKVVTTPNNQVWFEDIDRFDGYYTREPYHSHGHIDLLSSRKLNENSLDLILFLYDSASLEQYVYSKTLRRFINLPQEVGDGFVMKKDYSTSFLGLPNNYVEYTRKDSNGFSAKKAYNVLTNEFFSVGGYDTFFKLEVLHDQIIAFEPYVKDRLISFVYVYNILTNDFVHLPNGEIFSGYGGNQWGHLGIIEVYYSRNDDFYYLHTNYQREGDVAYIYCPKLNKFYHDDINGYTFCVYGHGIVFSNKELLLSTNTYRLPNPQDMFDILQNEQTREMSSAVHESKNSLMKLTENDVCSIIIETINKLL